MQFKYQEYFRVTFILPIVVIIGMLAILISASYWYWIKKAFLKNILFNAIKYSLCVLITIVCIVPNCEYLTNGGAYLLVENETNATTGKGVIEGIREPSVRFPEFKSHHKYGADITINGQIFFVITAGDIQEGDVVEILYLPRSGFILEINKTGNVRTGDGLREP